MNYPASRGRLGLCVMVCLFFAVFAAPALGDVKSYTTAVAEYELSYDDVFGEPSPSTPFFGKMKEFSALSKDGGSPELTDGTLCVTVTPLPGTVLGTITFREGGDYKLVGAINQTSEAYVMAMLFVDTFALVNRPGLTQEKVPLDKQLVTFEYSATLGPAFSDITDAGYWSLACEVNITDVLAAAGLERDDVATYQFSINNTLIASSESISTAYIEKKDFILEDEATVLIPEPSIFTLLLAGCCIMVARRRK